MQTTLRQPVCNGMLVPLYCHLFSLPHPASLHGLHLMWNMGDRPLFSSKVRTSLFLSPFVDPRGLEICITVPLSFQVIWGRGYSKAGESVENRFENVSVHGLSSFLNPTGGHVARSVTSATWKHPPQHCRSQKKKKRNRLLLVFCCLFKYRWTCSYLYYLWHSLYICKVNWSISSIDTKSKKSKKNQKSHLHLWIGQNIESYFLKKK